MEKILNNPQYFFIVCFAVFALFISLLLLFTVRDDKKRKMERLEIAKEILSYMRSEKEFTELDLSILDLKKQGCF